MTLSATTEADVSGPKHSSQIEITPAMVTAAAEVVLSRCGDEYCTMDWAMPIAEAILESALSGEGPLTASMRAFESKTE